MSWSTRRQAWWRSFLAGNKWGTPGLDAYMDRFAAHKEQLIGILRAECGPTFDPEDAWQRLERVAYFLMPRFMPDDPILRRGRRGRPSPDPFVASAIGALGHVYATVTGNFGRLPVTPIDRDDGVLPDIDRGFPALVSAFLVATGRQPIEPDGIKHIIRNARKAFPEFLPVRRYRRTY